MIELLYTALIMGLLGSGHCVAMCGSLSMAVSFSIPREKRLVNYAALISIGRILGYGIIGFIASALTQSIIKLTNGNILYLNVLASLFMIGIGLHVAKINSSVLKMEKLGLFINPIIEPIKKRLLPIDSASKCLSYGFFWGFLPCGMVYTALTLAFTASTPLTGALTMLVFGFGTLPTLVGLTVFQSKLNRFLDLSYVRFILGATIVLLALYQLYNAWMKMNTLG
jgi:sulfite exporter TauE/SafE